MGYVLETVEEWRQAHRHTDAFNEDAVSNVHVTRVTGANGGHHFLVGGSVFENCKAC